MTTNDKLLIKKGISLTLTQYNQIREIEGTNFSQKVRNIIDNYFEYIECIENKKKDSTTVVIKM